ncbi:F-box only protein 28 isoform X2 [Anthonomus grandis grandis]|uniref:F-box only protein 28 isoform X2 n=1 Tax=Anthonomus grandis grandis TaxID=2921223 RepID=UPI002165B339|nr:F-box only protein 28 isoform X2 [Anthonomus grandis grandis]
MCDEQQGSLLMLPEVALEKIFSFLSYDQIAKNRIVCTKFNEIGSKLLSRGFIQIEKRHAACFKRVKAALPRRESERNSHPMARHCDILQGVETRLSMLNMTYMRCMENRLICFIPGKVLDEIKIILDLVESNNSPPRTHLLLQELRDLSSMAIEHFDENIFPRCKEQLAQLRGIMYKNIASATKQAPGVLLPQPFPQRISNDILKVKKVIKTHKHHISYLAQTSKKLWVKMRKQKDRLRIQETKIRDQERKLQEQSTKIAEQEATIIDMKKHMDEWDQKYKDLTSELVRAKDEILLKTSPISSTHPMLPNSLLSRNILPTTAPTPSFKSNIKPRIANILPKSYLGFDLERKRKSSASPEVPLKRSRSPSMPGVLPSQNCLRNLDNVTINLPNLENFESETSKSGRENESESKLPETGSILGPFLDGLLKGKARKRKMTDDIDLK